MQRTCQDESRRHEDWRKMQFYYRGRQHYMFQWLRVAKRVYILSRGISLSIMEENTSSCIYRKFKEESVKRKDLNRVLRIHSLMKYTSFVNIGYKGDEEDSNLSNLTKFWKILNNPCGPRANMICNNAMHIWQSLAAIEPSNSVNIML